MYFDPILIYSSISALNFNAILLLIRLSSLKYLFYMHNFRILAIRGQEARMSPASPPSPCSRL